jgi:hypothetical protein
VQGGLVVAGKDRHGFLGKDGAVVHAQRGDVDRAPRDLHAVRQGVSHRMGTRKRRQQRRMGVEDSPVVGVEHRLGQHGHEPRHGNDIGVPGRERLDELFGVGGPVEPRPEDGARHELGVDAGRARHL